jgi:acetylglutamate kinase
MDYSDAARAQILTEALPYIRRLAGQVIVIKYGGAAMVDEALKKIFALNLILLRAVGIYPVVVHGGGPQIGKLLEKLAINSEFIQGMRVTSPEIMDVVQMVLVGQVNPSIVALVNQQGGRAVGLNGHDGRMLEAERMTLNNSSQPIDIGQVGRVTKVNPQILHSLEHDNFIPIIAPVGVGPDGESLNINADLAASALAIGLRAGKLILLTDTSGVWDHNRELIPELKAERALQLIADGVIVGGMLPKIKCCLEALDAGVSNAHIIDGRKANALLLEIFTDQGVGTILKSY